MHDTLFQVYYAQAGEDMTIFLLFSALVFVSYKYLKLRSIHRKNQKELMQKVISQNQQIGKLELDSTRFQLNPHAFKNTLTVVKLLAERTSSAIDKLSEVLDYMIYETRANFVSIEKEVMFLESFLEFNQLKSIGEGGNFRVSNHIDSNHPFQQQPVLPPLITAYFIENAFKHGLLQTRDDLSISLEMRGNRFVYTVSNTINPVKYKGLGGVGYDNMKRRLQTIFPHRHTLDNQVVGSRFVAHLEIELRIRNEQD